MFLLLSAIIACAPQDFGTNLDVGPLPNVPNPDSLTFELYPDSGYTNATLLYISSEMGDWERLDWSAAMDGGDGLEVEFYDAPDEGWIGFYGWITAPALYEPKQLCSIGQGIEYPGGDVFIKLSKGEVDWGYSAQMDGDACILVYEWWPEG